MQCVLGLLAVLLLAPAAAKDAPAGAPPASRTSLVAVIPPDSPPTYYRDQQTGQAAGFAVDVMNGVAGNAGLTVTYHFEDGWSDIIDRLKRGQADVVPGMGVSRDREKDLAFSAPIDAFPISFFVRTEHAGIDASPGVHTVGVIRGSVAFEKLKDRADLGLVPYEGFPQGLFDLLAGRIQAFACPAPTLWQLARETGVADHIKVVDKPIAEITRAIAVRKDNKALLERLNAGIRAYVGSPAYQQAYVKWYGRTASAWTPARIITLGAVLLLAAIGSMGVWRHLSVLRLNRELAVALRERDKAAADVLQNHERLESLVRISQRPTESTQALLDFALEEAIRLTRSRIGYIYFYNEDKREFTLNTWSREVMKECAVAGSQQVYQLEKTGIWGEAVRQRKPIIVQDYPSPHPLKKGYPTGHVHLRNFLTVPVFQQDRIVAVIGVANKQTDYAEDDIRQLTLLIDAVWRMAEQKRTEAALQENEAVLRSFLNAVTESALLMDRQGRVLAANETVAKRMGTTLEQLVGSGALDLLPPGVAQERRAHLDAVFRTGVPARFQDERRGRVIDNSLYPVFDPSGTAIAIIGIDITEQVQAAKAIEQSEKKHRMLYDSAIDGILILDLQGHIIDCNRTAHERLGYGREELLALHVSQLDPPEYAAQVGDRMKRLGEQGRLIMESAHIRRDGTVMPVEINARVIDYEGRQAIFSIVRDITERKLAEQERERLIAQLQKALAEIKTLHGLLPICSACKKIRDEQGAWHQLEVYISGHTDAEFTHGLCADCMKKLYPQYTDRKR